MPYRRLPNTDLARVRALKAALSISMRKPRHELAFSYLLLQKIDVFMPKYELAIRNYRQALAQQSQRSKDYNQKLRKAKLYVSHFIQVLNFAIIRGEIKPEAREFYGIKKTSKSTPSLMQDANEAFNNQRILRQNTQRLLDKVAEHRKEADDLILKLWNEVEKKFEHLNDEAKRKACSEYGIVYVWRRGEKERLQQQKKAEQDTLTLAFADTEKTN